MKLTGKTMSISNKVSKYLPTVNSGSSMQGTQPRFLLLCPWKSLSWMPVKILQSHQVDIFLFPSSGGDKGRQLRAAYKYKSLDKKEGSGSNPLPWSIPQIRHPTPFGHPDFALGNLCKSKGSTSSFPQRYRSHTWTRPQRKRNCCQWPWHGSHHTTSEHITYVCRLQLRRKTGVRLGWRLGPMISRAPACME